MLLTSVESQQVLVTRYCREAFRAGVRPMMSLPLAQALVPDAHTEPFDPIRDYNALYALAVWCLRFSPLVGIDHELSLAHKRDELRTLSSLHYGITIDLTGTEKLHGDIDLLCQRVDALFQHRARISAAPTIGGAWALSHFGPHTPCVARSIPALTEALTHLPIRSLRVDRLCLERLADVGVYTVGELLSLPRHTLGQRFGKPLVYRLHQALGSLEERLNGVEERARYERHRIFEPPLTNRRAITIAIESLFHDLLRHLRAEHISAGLFSLVICDTASQHVCKEFPLSSATNDTKHLLSIIQPIIDSMRFCGEAREIILRANDTTRSIKEQKSFTPQTLDARDVARSYRELLNTFGIRIGKDRVSLARLNDSYIPERSFSYQSAIGVSRDTHDVVMESPAPYSPRERPPSLFPTPEPITTIAMLPDKPPSCIQWRDTRLPIISGHGPERIAPEWWRGDVRQELFSTRDYFTIQDHTGRWLWVFRDQRTHEWFVHGSWT